MEVGLIIALVAVALCGGVAGGAAFGYRVALLQARSEIERLCASRPSPDGARANVATMGGR
jgi:hypothetical protein